MKKYLFILVLVLLGIFSYLKWHKSPITPTEISIEKVSKIEYIKLQDSISILNTKLKRIAILQDSLAVYKIRPLMTKEQFIDLYKYERLYKYYLLCKKNPKQWVYYKGWSIRVFEE